jgi:hypothetical protein
MTASGFTGPSLAISEIGSGGLEVFRVVRTDNPEDPVLLNSLRSHFALEMPPRRIERRSAALHMGISVYLSRDRAAETARRFPAIGGFVAALRLTMGHGFNVAHTGPPGHLTLWGDPVKLARVAGDISSVGD